MDRLQHKINYRFKKTELLKAALTHSSISSNVGKNYERLEFLGDRLLGVAVASMLYKTFSAEPEGNLSQRFVALVCKETVAEVARKIGLGQFILVADEEIRNSENVLCDVCEALIGALYLDAGINEAMKFVENYWSDLIDKRVSPPKDAKTLLQEVAHIKGLGAPAYKVVKRSGLEHEPIFTVEVSLGCDFTAQGKGHNKKLAEFAAATKMLELLDK